MVAVDAGLSYKRTLGLKFHDAIEELASPVVPGVSVSVGGSEKEGGGNDASLHSAMFDSARVRGVLSCYDAIDRVVRGLSLSL